VGEEGAVDDVGEAAAEEPERLLGRVALLDASLEVLAAERRLAGLRDRDPVQRRVDLAVAGAGESVAGGVARPDGLRRGPVPAGVGALGSGSGWRRRSHRRSSLRSERRSRGSRAARERVGLSSRTRTSCSRTISTIVTSLSCNWAMTRPSSYQVTPGRKLRRPAGGM